MIGSYVESINISSVVVNLTSFAARKINPYYLAVAILRLVIITTAPSHTGSLITHLFQHDGTS